MLRIKQLLLLMVVMLAAGPLRAQEQPGQKVLSVQQAVEQVLEQRINTLIARSLDQISTFSWLETALRETRLDEGEYRRAYPPVVNLAEKRRMLVRRQEERERYLALLVRQRMELTADFILMNATLKGLGRLEPDRLARARQAFLNEAGEMNLKISALTQAFRNYQDARRVVGEPTL